MDGGKLARRLLLLRSWERQHMPMAGSIIAGDIVLLALARDDGDAARVKDFHLSLHYSEDRVSQVLLKATSTRDAMIFDAMGSLIRLISGRITFKQDALCNLLECYAISHIILLEAKQRQVIA